jgi:hypothetical protein
VPYDWTDWALAGRPLVVAVYHVTGFTWKIIGARDMTDTELVEFNFWEETDEWER